MSSCRPSLSYNSALKRYLWVQVLPGAASRQGRTRDKDPRFRGGFGIYDSPEPWGPWTTVYYNDQWSADQGADSGWTIHHKFPTAWMSKDGRTLWLAFSGEYKPGGQNYCLLARKATLTVSGGC